LVTNSLPIELLKVPKKIKFLEAQKQLHNILIFLEESNRELKFQLW